MRVHIGGFFIIFLCYCLLRCVEVFTAQIVVITIQIPAVYCSSAAEPARIEIATDSVAAVQMEWPYLCSYTDCSTEWRTAKIHLRSFQTSPTSALTRCHAVSPVVINPFLHPVHNPAQKTGLPLFTWPTCSSTSVRQARRVRQPLRSPAGRRRSWRRPRPELIPAEAEAVTKPASVLQDFGDPGAGGFLQVGDLDELRQHLGHGLHRLRHRDRGAQRGHGTGDVDHRAQAQAAADILSVRLLRPHPSTREFDDGFDLDGDLAMAATPC